MNGRKVQVFAARLIKPLGVAALACALAGPLFAQENAPVRFSGSLGAGFVNPLYTTGHQLDMGWGVNAGAGASFGPWFGINGEFMFNSLGVNSTTLNRLQFPNGDMRLYSVTLDPIIHLNRQGRFDAYIIGGGGWYHRRVEFTQPSVATFTAFDPFFGLVYPVAIPTSQVLRSNAIDKGGLNIGGGITIGMRGMGRAKLYAEARYHHMYTRPNATVVLPVTFGVRW